MAFPDIKTDDIINFFERHIIYHFEITNQVMSDNWPSFKSHKLYWFTSKYKIKWQYSTINNVRANGLAGAFNKTLGCILNKTITKNQKDWQDRIHETL